MAPKRVPSVQRFVASTACQQAEISRDRSLRRLRKSKFRTNNNNNATLESKMRVRTPGEVPKARFPTAIRKFFFPQAARRSRKVAAAAEGRIDLAIPVAACAGALSCWWKTCSFARPVCVCLSVCATPQGCAAIAELLIFVSLSLASKRQCLICFLFAFHHRLLARKHFKLGPFN